MVQEQSAAANAPADWRNSRWLAFVEFAMVAAVFIADRFHHIYLSKTPYLLALGWASLRLRGRTWRDVGFSRNQSWAQTLAWGVGGGLVLEVFQLLVTQPILAHFSGRQPDLSEFAEMRGNFKYFLLLLAFAWTFAALGEELVWRGYLLNRVAELGRHTRFAWVCALLLVSAVFGTAHSYQGITGIIEEGLAGLFLAVMYMATGKKLAVPILAHGASDTLDAVLLFLGKMPGM